MLGLVDVNTSHNRDKTWVQWNCYGRLLLIPVAVVGSSCYDVGMIPDRVSEHEVDKYLYKLYHRHGRVGRQQLHIRKWIPNHILEPFAVYCGVLSGSTILGLGKDERTHSW